MLVLLPKNSIKLLFSLINDISEIFILASPFSQVAPSSIALAWLNCNLKYLGLLAWFPLTSLSTYTYIPPFSCLNKLELEFPLTPSSKYNAWST